MKMLLKSLATRKFSSFLIMLEIMFAMVYFMSVACSIQQVFEVNIRMPREVTCDTNRLLEIVFDDVREKDFVEVKNNLINSKLVENCAYIDINEQIGAENEKSIVRISKGFNGIRDFDVKKGRKLKSEDYEMNSLGILIGQNVAKEYGYSIGDDFEYECGDAIETKTYKYKIVGILKDNSTIFSQRIADGTIANMDNAVVLPIIENTLLYVPGMTCYSVVSEDVSVENAKNKIKAEFSKKNIRCDVNLIGDVLNNQFEENYNSNKNWLIIAIVMVVLSMVGVSTTIYSSLHIRRKEMGIKLALGYTKGQIKRFIVYENAIITVVAYLLAVIIARWFNNDNSGYTIHQTVGLYLSSEIIVIAGIVALFYIILPIIIVYINLRNIQPRTLIGGRE